MKNKALYYVRFDKLLRALRGLMLAAIVLFVVGGAWHLFSGGEPIKTLLESNLDVSDDIKTKINGFKMVEKSGNNDFWTVEAGKASLTGDQMRMDEVRMDYKSGKKADASFKLNAAKAEMDVKTQNAVFSGGVTVKTPRPVTVETDRLDWTGVRRIISTELPVRVSVNSGVITGRDLVLTLDKQTLTLNKPVRARFGN
jgi:LPS export ABC transporter protein LptC